MVHTFFKSEHNEIKWRKMIDFAIEMHFKIEYSVYGNIVYIDSTDAETRVMQSTEKASSDSRIFWAEFINSQLIEKLNK